MSGPQHARERIGLLAAIPLSREEVEADIRNASGDFVRNILCNGEPNLSTWNDFEDQFQNVEEKLRELTALGVSVHRGVGTTEFARFSRSFDVIVLLSHWKDSKVIACDIGDPGAVAERLLTGSDDEMGFLRALAGFDEMEAVAKAMRLRDATSLAKHLSSILNRLIDEQDLAPERACVDRKAQNRAHLVEVFQPLLVPGDRVEFRDRMVDERTLAELLPKEFAGVLELLVCHSSGILANQIRLARPDCICLSNRDVAFLDLRLIRLTATCKTLLQVPCSYLEALSIAKETLDSKHQRWL